MAVKHEQAVRSGVVKTGVWMMLVCSGLASQSMAGQYNLCIDGNGRHSYTEAPCPGGQKAIVRQYESMPASKPEDSAARISTDNPQYIEVRDSNRQRELERRLLQLQRQLADSEQKMAAELTPLQEQRDGIAGNNAGNRRAAVDVNIQSTRARYQQYHDYLSKQMAEVTAEMAALKAKSQ